MMLENCVYDFFELTIQNMDQQGVFGEILHVEGSYIHNLEEFLYDRLCFYPEQIEETVPDHENLSAHSFVPVKVRDGLIESYRHPIAKDIEEKTKEVGGHGGMDFISPYRRIGL